jgi:hypothetical protein
MQYYLTFDNSEPGFDACFESCGFANSSEELEAIERQLGLKNHFEFFSYAGQAHLFPLGSEEAETLWFSAQEGIDWLEAMLTCIRENPSSVRESEQLTEDLSNCRDILLKVNGIGAKWHFEMDI